MSHATLKPRLTSERVVLLPATQQDYEFLYELEGSEQPLRPWLYGTGMPAREDYVELLYSSTVAVMVAVDSESGSRFGAMLAYNADVANGTMWIAATTRRSTWDLGRPVQALAMFIDYCFTTWDVRTVYFEFRDSLLPRVASVAHLVGSICGRYTSHDYHDGHFVDRVVASISRNRWKELPARVVGLPGTSMHKVPADEIGLAAFCRLVEEALQLTKGAVVPGSRLIDDLGLDSLALYCFMCLLEDISGWRLPDGLFENLETVEDGYAYASTRLEASGRGPQ